MKKYLKLAVKLKYVLFLVLMSNFTACTNDDEAGCETETVCFGDGNCIERPVPGTCF